ncbi:MAG: hypothetical protein Q8K75_09695 [Chlamydiales bacterium]|nr:hypothetical protein [Chlamydiales bacterium]
MTVVDSAKTSFFGFLHAKPAATKGKTSLEIDNNLVAAMQTYGPFVVAAFVATQAIVPYSIGAATGVFAGQPLKNVFDQVFNVWNQQNFALQIAAGGVIGAGAVLAPLPTAIVSGVLTGGWAGGKMSPAEALAWAKAQVGA